MSVYADFDTISSDYDDARKPNGAHLYLGLIYSLTGKTKETLHLLDIGCGTGNHVKYLLHEGLGKATIFDACTGMLEKAKSKLKDYVTQDRVVIEQHLLPKIPFEDSRFDVVMCNQVLHHLRKLDDMEADNNAVVKVVQEAYRVLKPGGVLIINMCTPYQIIKGFWYTELSKESSEKTAARVLEPKKLLSMMRQAGFSKEGMLVEPLMLAFNEEVYFREDGLLSADWRSCDSCLASLPPEELQKGTETVLKLREEGKLKEFMLEADSMREHVGQYGIFYGKKNV